jgi:hypothetical protein
MSPEDFSSINRLGFSAAEGAQCKLFCGPFQKAILFALHPAPRDQRAIIETVQMQQPMQQVADKFAFPSDSKLARLAHCICNANENLPMERGSKPGTMLS